MSNKNDYHMAIFDSANEIGTLCVTVHYKHRYIKYGQQRLYYRGSKKVGERIVLYRMLL